MKRSIRSFTLMIGIILMISGNAVFALDGRFNVQDYGAVGDGVTDDTSAIESAINAAEEGDSILFPKGLYLVTTLEINKNVTLVGLDSWGITPGGGVTIVSDTSDVPVIDYTSSAASHIKLTNIRVDANSDSTCCVRIHTAHNGFEFDRVYLKGFGCPTGLIVQNGSWLYLKDIYTTGFTDANITNEGVSRLIIKGGLHNVATNAFVYVNGMIGGNLQVEDTYLEWTSGSVDIIKLNNTQTPTSVVIKNLYQSAIGPNSIIRNMANVSSPDFQIMNYRGMPANYLYLDDNVASWNIAYNSGYNVSHKIANVEYITSIPRFTDGDSTPSVKGSKIFKTANSSQTTITMFDDGYVGQEIKVIFNDNNTKVDFTGTNLRGNRGVDWNPVWANSCMTCVFDGQNWYCNTSDHN